MENRDFGERVAAVKRELRSRSTDGVERRTQTSTLEVRASDEGWQIVGHGIVYNSLSENLGGFREMVSPGAADAVLASGPDVRGLLNHNPDLVLGRTIAGTMTLTSDATGVRYVIDPPDTSYARDLRVSLERGDITQSSFAFRIARGGEEWEEDDESGLLIRTITKFSGLYDMSPVTYPAYPAADSGLQKNSAPPVERDDDEPAEAAHQDGDEGTRQAEKVLSRNYVARDLAARARLL